MKKELALAIICIVATVLAFVVNAHCEHTKYPWASQMYFLIALFFFHACWCAMCVTEKQHNDVLSIVGANLGLGALLFCVVIAFLNIRWWIVLLFIPFTWFVAGLLGGRAARKFPASWLFLLISVSLMSFMVHVFYIYS